MAEKGSDLTYDFCCNICEDDSVSKEAMFFCQQCSKGLCDDCFGLHRQFYKKHVAYGREAMDKWPVFTKSLDDLKFCEQHSDHLIEMFCEDHRKLCCSMCHFHNHRHCGKLLLIKEKFQAVHDAGALINISSSISDVQQKLVTAIDETREYLKKLQDSYDIACVEIKALRQKINDILDELERNTIRDLDTLLHTRKQSLQSDTDTCLKAINSLKKIGDAINNIEKGQKDISFIAYQKGFEMSSEAENLLKELAVNKSPSVAFNKNPCIEHTLSDLSTLGSIECVEKQSYKNENFILECKTQFLQDIRITSDKTIGDIRGICELSCGDILIVDKRNKRVKLLDIQYKVVAHADLIGSPMDMCTISPTEVAVTIEESKTNMIVQFLNVKDRQIYIGRTLDFKHKCHGIAFFKNTLFITSLTALYQYTMDGQLVKKIYEDTAGFQTVYKCAVSPDGSRLYIINYSHDNLLTLSTDGTVLSSLKNPAFHNPRGVHVIETGQLLVCGDTNNVVQVDGEGGVVTLATKINGLDRPDSVYYSAHTGRLIVGYNSTSVLVINTK
ncbi:uncharacterized protein LOC127872861 isoform X2 [Dreissena polymorpha]|uniref:uncharacterized protein LOC127872861 isoform X2 n=1 Tax=Dreissena polymorpha TaxID=45954 RepID=UPI002264A2A8|nr:uncharacterized protein LOC127872861 isoform X2 [Dreissena polymorpha]